MQSTQFSKQNFKQISLNLLLSGSLLVSNINTVSANETLEKQYMAVYQSTSTTPSSFTELSAENMLEMADSLYTPQMSHHQKKLEFALIFSAAYKGLAEAQFRLANYFIESDVITPNESEAAFWLEEAMVQGHKNAKFVYDNVLVYNYDIGC